MTPPLPPEGIPQDIAKAAERLFDDMLVSCLSVDDETGLPTLSAEQAVMMLARAILAERERDARIADAEYRNLHNDAGRHLAGRIAAAIRKPQNDNFKSVPHMGPVA